MSTPLFGPLAAALVGVVALGAGDEPWHREAEQDGVVVEWQTPGTGVPWVRGTTVLAAPADAVRDVVADVAQYERFMPRTARSEWLARDGGTGLAYQRFSAPWPLADRDSVCRVTEGRAPDGSQWLALDDEESPARPPVAGVVRLKPVHLRWTLAPLDGGQRTRVTYEYLGVLGGDLPTFMKRREWREEPILVLRAVRDRVAR